MEINYSSSDNSELSGGDSEGENTHVSWTSITQNTSYKPQQITKPTKALDKLTPSVKKETLEKTLEKDKAKINIDKSQPDKQPADIDDEKHIQAEWAKTRQYIDAMKRQGEIYVQQIVRGGGLKTPKAKSPEMHTLTAAELKKVTDNLNKFPELNKKLTADLIQIDEAHKKLLGEFKNKDSPSYKSTLEQLQKERKDYIQIYPTRLRYHLAKYGLPKTVFNELIKYDTSTQRTRDTAEVIHAQGLKNRMPMAAKEGKPAAENPQLTDMREKILAKQKLPGGHVIDTKTPKQNKINTKTEFDEKKIKEPTGQQILTSKTAQQHAMYSFGIELNKVLADAFHTWVRGEQWDWQPYVKYTYKLGTDLYRIKYDNHWVNDRGYSEQIAREWVQKTRREMYQWIDANKSDTFEHPDYTTWLQYKESLKPIPEKRTHRLVDPTGAEREYINKRLKKGPGDIPDTELAVDSKTKQDETTHT